LPLFLRIVLGLVLAAGAAVAALLWLVSARTGFGASEWVLGAAAGGGGAAGIERIELDLDLRKPPELRGVATLHGRGGPGELDFLLNRGLDVVRVVEDGVERAWKDGPKLRSDYHKEARLVRVERPANEGAWSVTVEYAGRGLTGKEERDWMGVLLMAPDELRMSVQTVFYPEFEPDLAGPGVAPLPSSVRVKVPAGFEVHVPGRRVEGPVATEGGAAWRFDSELPTVLSLFAAPRVRSETELGDARVVTLLRKENEHLGEAFAAEARKILDAYGRWWGKIGARTLGVCEIESRGGSYNWAAQGIVTLDRHAIDGAVPVEKLAHEIAHLWWGQEVVATGRGERFLTEGLAEYASWRYLADAHGPERARTEIDAARAAWLGRAHELGRDPPLADVTFATKGYQELAYAKGPLALLALERRAGTAEIDALLRRYRASAGAAGAASRGAGALDAFVAALGALGEPTLVLPWLASAGHAHLALAEVVREGGATRGRIVAAKCPSGCPVLAPSALEVAARWPGRTETLELAWKDAELHFAAPWDAPHRIELDPRALVLGDVLGADYAGPATLVATEPRSGAKDVPLGPLTVRATFGAPLDALPATAVARIQQACWDGAPPGENRHVVVSSATLADEGRTLVVAVDGTRPEALHVLAVPDGVLASGGLPLPGLRVEFTTRAADPAHRPTVVASLPAQGASDVPSDLAAIRVTFSEPMRTQTGFKKPAVAALERQGWRYPPIGDIRWEDARTLVIELTEPLAAGQGYGLPFGERWLDREGNQVVPFDLTFTTRGAR
jgi:hypothetical protein